MNFDFDKLYLVNPCEIDDECYIRAVHASSILDKARIYDSFDEAVKNIDFLVATSSKQTFSEKKHLRNPIFLQDFSKQINKVDGKVGLIFGREDYGLLNDEIAKSDMMLKIQTSDKYQALNLSHSVGLVLYSLYLQKTNIPEQRSTIDNLEKTHLYNTLYVSGCWTVHCKEYTIGTVPRKRSDIACLPKKLLSLLEKGVLPGYSR